MKALEQKLEQKEPEVGQSVGALQVEAGRALEKMEPFMQVSFESGTWKREGLPPGETGMGWGANMKNSTSKSQAPPSKCLGALKQPSQGRGVWVLSRE